MCVVGDIILVDRYKHKEHSLSKHSFVVLSIEADKIEGLDYDFICNVLSSFKNEQQKAKKLSYAGNFEISHADAFIVDGGNKKDGFVKAEQFYYFNKQNINYSVIGQLHADVFNRLIEFIENLDEPIEHIIDNLQATSRTSCAINS